MLIKATYNGNEKECYLNSDCIIDIFQKWDKWQVYTIDNERMGYTIEQSEFDKLMKYMNEEEYGKDNNI